jgi:hypothetical protein
VAGAVVMPGYAKPRSELPWLPYESLNRVIINAHNFTPAWNASVNGKSPIAAWVPSRDTAGNGTTTLTDLVDSNNGTLTNMVPASDWVSDTNLGGVRAIKFDGSNDSVVASAPAITAQMSQSYWFKRDSINSLAGFAGFGVSASDANRFVIQPYNDGRVYVTMSGANWGSFATNDTNWHHVVAVFDGSLTGNSSRLKVWFDGSAVTLSFTGTIPASIGSPSALWIGRTFAAVNVYGSGRVDDYRIFGQALTGTDAASLYSAQRGGQA